MQSFLKHLVNDAVGFLEGSGFIDASLIYWFFPSNGSISNNRLKLEID